MADAWKVVVDREPEWTPQARAEAIAAVVSEQITCPHCGNAESVIEVDLPGTISTHFVWPPRAKGDTDPVLRDGEKAYRLRQYRCVGCIGIAVAQRQLQKSAEQDGDPAPGKPTPTDATFHRAVPFTPPQPRAGTDGGTSQ